MKSLLLMRHAKSSWKDPRLEDHRRPLNPRGERDVKEMGRRFKSRGLDPQLIVSSDARRAMDTARAIAGSLGMATAAIRPDPALYLASADRIMRIVAALDDAFERVMLFGHNPGFTEFVNLFHSTPIANLPTAGIVELTFNTGTWGEVGPCHVVTICIDFPKNR